MKNSSTQYPTRQRIRSGSKTSQIGFWLTVVSVLLCFRGDLAGQEVDFVNAHRDLSLTAVRIQGRITIDGRLDEPEWRAAEPADDFIQKLPQTGHPASEPTEVRVLYNDESLYVGAHCFDSAGKEGIVVNDITRDFYTLDSDGFQIVLDTYNDDRNSFLFATNPGAGMWDMQIAADGDAGNSSWDGIWYLNTTIDDDGWHVEMEIPFKTLRFSGDFKQIWGINFERRVRRKFEDSYWAPLPPAYRLGRVSLAGTLVGIEGIKQSRNFYVKPYITAPIVKREDDDVDFLPDTGFDVKYALTSQLTLDGTVNTDFSQVEADEEQINLTRFSLFFPEKRDFFLENAGIFEWGRKRRSEFSTPEVMPFFSRRIGLTDDGEIVPIMGGARLTGRAGEYSLGLMTMQAMETEEVSKTNFSVLRVRRDVLRKSDVGGLFINKRSGEGTLNRTYGVDGNFTLLNYMDISSSVLRTDTPDLPGQNLATDVTVAWRDDFFETKASHIRIGENFNPEVGFVPRTGIHKSSADFGITPRPEKRIAWIRELNPSIEVDYITDTEGQLVTRTAEARFTVTFADSSLLSVARESNFERLDEEFEIRDDLSIPVGDYNFNDNSLYFRTDRSRLVVLETGLHSGTFFTGDRDSYLFGLTVQPSHRFNAELSWRHNDVGLADGDFTTDLITSRFTYSFSNKMFLNALIQYNSDLEEVLSNIRFNFIHKPLSDFFLVYNERRSTEGDVIDRALIAKLTYVLAF